MDAIARYLAAVITVGLAVLALWQLGHATPVIPDAANGLFLLILGVVVGLRIGYQSTRTFINDAVRMNRAIVELNGELTQLNGWLMKQILIQKTTSDRSRTLAEQEREANG